MDYRVSVTAPQPFDPLAPAHPTRVAVVGTGAVGSTFAFGLLLSGLASEILLVDANERKAEGEAMDLMHAVPFARNARVWSGPIEDCQGAAVTVIAAGAAQRPGETRIDLVQKNAAIFRQLVPRIAEANPGGIILVATNPVDVLSYLTWRISGLPSERVIGSGTVLDTARFRMLLAEHYGVDPRSVHAWMAGEHGDTEVPVWIVGQHRRHAARRLRDDDRHRRRIPRRSSGSTPTPATPRTRSSSARAPRTTPSPPASCASWRRSCATSTPSCR